MLPVKAADVRTVNFCELLKAPAKFAGQMVSVRARVDKSYHWIVLRSNDCEGTIMLELRAEVEPPREFALNKNKDFEALDKALYDFKPGTMELRNRVEADFAGRFDSVLAVKGKQEVRIAQGYGQGLRAKTRLVLKTVTNATVTPI